MTARLGIIIFLICLAVVVYALTKKPHDFEYSECAICHPAVKTNPLEIYPDITGSCQECHSDLNDIQMHPTDIVPELRVPSDMPLFEGKLTCLTCHFAHPDRNERLVEKSYFLRRQSRGYYFCSICHTVDEDGHIVLEVAHTGQYEELDPDVKIDFLSLSCLKCHENTVNKKELNALGAGMWRHPERAGSNHPIGIDYEEFSRTQSIKDYFPAADLKIKLFDGKIGCGTCHSITSKRKKILAMEETMLCLQCHNRKGE